MPRPDDETLALPDASAADDPSTPARSTAKRLPWVRMAGISLPILAALGALWNPATLQRLDRDLQSTFTRIHALQNPHPAPPELVIVAIDDDSLNQFQQNPPIKRDLYARAIDRLMKAGARAIAVDILFETPSTDTLGTPPADCSEPQLPLSESDRALQSVLKTYADRLVLAVQYEQFTGQGDSWQQDRILLPYCPFRVPNLKFGLINFPYPAANDERIFQFGDRLFDQTPPDQRPSDLLPSLSLTLLQIAQRPEPKTPLHSIPFLAPPGQGFRLSTIPMWHILSDENWNSASLEGGKYFKDKLIILGGTAAAYGDVVTTAVGRMNGVELHAHAVAALLQNREIKPLFREPWQIALFVLLLTGIPIVRLVKPTFRSPVKPMLLLFGSAGMWLGLSYGTFAIALIQLPTVLPSLALTSAALIAPIVTFVRSRRSQAQLRNTLKRYGGSPLIQEIIQQQPDPNLQNLLTERQQELESKTLAGRYKITQILSSGGFSETYLAQDMQLPGTPTCVVKQLRPRSNEIRHLRLARRLFDREAKTLLQLGSYDRIPQLLAFFEEDAEFYLIQQYIPGNPLSSILTLGRQLPEINVLGILAELLQILDFVHKNGVVHRDIKPSNIIQRLPDQHLVLIDFGAVKALETLDEENSNLTIGIGTQGYMAPEQQLGYPRPESDLYSVGILGIQALSGLPASQLIPHPETQIISWQAHAQVSITLASILNKLTHPNPQLRYRSAQEALIALIPLLPNIPYDRRSSQQVSPQSASPPLSPLSSDLPTAPPNAELLTSPTDVDNPTRFWSPDADESTDLPPTDQS